MHNMVTQKVKTNGKLGEGFDTFYGVKHALRSEWPFIIIYYYI